MTSVGYAALSTSFLVSGEAKLRVPADIRITDVKKVSFTNEGYDTYNPEYYKEGVKLFTTLPNLNSSVTYQVEVTNNSDLDYYLEKINNITYSNNNMKYVIDGINIESIVDGNTKITFDITVSYLDNVTVLPSDNLSVFDIEFIFKLYDTIPPTVEYSIFEGYYNTNKSVVITPIDNVSGIDYYHIHIYKNGEILEKFENLKTGSHTVTLEEGTYEIRTYVVDKAGNKIEQEPIKEENWYYQTYIIDKTKPTLTISNSTGTYDTSGSVTLTVQDIGGSGLSDSNKYQYCLSTSNESATGCTWTTYTSGTSFTINGTDQNKYLWVYSVSDKAGNINGDYKDVTVPYIIGTYKFISTYTISYDLGGGTVTGNPTSYNIETETFTLKNPIRDGYIFIGWSGSNGTTLQMNVTIEKGSIGNKSYKANWTPIAYSLTYNLNGGTVTGNPAGYNIETETFTLVNPTRDGYTFTGWTGSNGVTPQTSVSISKGTMGNKSYTANWTPVNYSISYNLNGGTVTKNPTSYNIETETFILNNPIREGYIFAGWTGSNGNEPAINLSITKGSTGNKSYTANWMVDCSDKPIYTYTGSHQLIDDGNDDWRIKFLTDGTFTLTKPFCTSDVGVFLVGGGGSGGSRQSGSLNYGGGGSGGYTTTETGLAIVTGTPYVITIGQGGSAVSGSGVAGKPGETTSAFGYSAAGGGAGSATGGGTSGGAGGSGGGGADSAGGSDGNNGGGSYGNAGQGTTTREFGEFDGTLYAGGGGGALSGAGGSGGGGAGGTVGTSGTANTGGGGGGGTSESGAGGSGLAILRVHSFKTTTIDANTSYAYTGKSTVVDDENGNWRIKFLTSGILVFKNLNVNIDLFLVGGGGSGGSRQSGSLNYGGGGSGGYTTTETGLTITTGTQYVITIGQGGIAITGSGVAGKPGEATSAFGYSAAGGGAGSATGGGTRGGAGGSGGGGADSAGGSDGKNGGGSYGNVGQGTTTREFGESGGTLYAGGGGGALSGAGGSGGGGAGGTVGTSGTANTGGGGGGGTSKSGAGGTGIVVIRNTFENLNYTYTGESELINDGNRNWRIKFLTSGTFILEDPDINIEAFLVGGGGAGFNNGGRAVGGGGYYTIGENISLTTGTPYEIVVGTAGKSLGESGMPSSAFDLSALGGNAATSDQRKIGEVRSCSCAQGGSSVIRYANGTNVSSWSYLTTNKADISLKTPLQQVVIQVSGQNAYVYQGTDGKYYFVTVGAYVRDTFATGVDGAGGMQTNIFDTSDVVSGPGTSSASTRPGQGGGSSSISGVDGLIVIRNTR